MRISYFIQREIHLVRHLGPHLILELENPAPFPFRTGNGKTGPLASSESRPRALCLPVPRPRCRIPPPALRFSFALLSTELCRMVFRLGHFSPAPCGFPPFRVCNAKTRPPSEPRVPPLCAPVSTAHCRVHPPVLRFSFGLHFSRPYGLMFSSFDLTQFCHVHPPGFDSSL